MSSSWETTENAVGARAAARGRPDEGATPAGGFLVSSWQETSRDPGNRAADRG